jgi:hypothetical protein
MLKELVVKLLKKVVKSLESDKKVLNVSEYCALRAEDKPKSYSLANDKVNVKNFDKPVSIMQERILEQDEIKEAVLDVQAQIMAKGYKAMEEILREQHISVVQSFVMNQLLALGNYDPEHDNLDKNTFEQLIEMAKQNNQLQYEMRMIEMGKANITQAQMKAIENICKRNNVTFNGKNKFDASRFIDSHIEKDKKPAEMIGNITKKQNDTIVYLCKTLNKPFVECKNIVEASNAIAELKKELELHPELKPKASEAQVDYIKRLLKALNKRWTKVQDAKYRNMSIEEASATIAELKKSVPEDNNISEGQVEFIIQLLSRLNRPYNKAEIKAMTKQDATKLIARLRRDFLLVLSRSTMTNLTKDDVKAMTDDAVKELTNQMLMELKTNSYTKSTTEVEETTSTH